jgi:hypothetical protein
MKSFSEFIDKSILSEKTAEGYHQTNGWTDSGLTHKRWDKDHPHDSPTDRHQSSIELWHKKGEEPVYHASHRIEKGYWTNQSTRQSPTKVTHKSTHSSLEDAKSALKNHTDELYKKS